MPPSQMWDARLDPRLAAFLSGELEEAAALDDTLAGVLGSVARVSGMAGLAGHVRADPSLRSQALALLPWLVEDGADALGNANDVAVAALVDALCRAGVPPEGLGTAFAGRHGLWWADLALASHEGWGAAIPAASGGLSDGARRMTASPR